jgi:hypothetical protein
MPIILPDGTHLYNDTNWRELLVPPPGIYWTSLEGFGCRPRFEHPHYHDFDAIPFREYKDDFDLIPRSEWSERIAEMDAKQMWPKDHIRFRSYDQGSLGYCWINGPCQACTTLRDMQGHPHVRYSSASVGGPIKHYRNEGGWPEEGVDYLIRHGAVTQDLWPNNSLDRSLYEPTLDDRRFHKATEAYKCSRESFDEAITAVLRGHIGTVSYMWWGHAITGAVRVVNLDGTDRWGLEIRNSWGDDWGSKNRHGVGGFSVLEYPGRGDPDDVIVLSSVTAAQK